MDEVDLRQLSVLHGITIAHLNINRLSNKVDQLKLLLELSDIDIMCISETFLVDTFDDDELAIPGYDIYRCDRADFSVRGSGGGVCVYTRNVYNIEFVSEMSHSDNDWEVITVKLKLKNCRPIFIACVYRPPHGNIRRFCTKFSNVLEFPSILMCSETAVLGDFNIDFAKANSVEARVLKYLMQSFLLNQYVMVPARISEQSATQIDLIFYNREEMRASSGVISCGISDHSMIFFQRKSAKKKAPARVISVISLRNFNEAQFRMDIANADWSDVLSAASSEDSWFLFKVKFNAYLDKHAPIKDIKIRGKLPGWINHDFISLMDLRDKAKRVHNRTRTHTDGEIFRVLRNAVATLSKSLKCEFISSQIEQCKGNAKKLWKFLSTLIPGRKTGNNGPIDINGKVDSSKIANHFNQYFCNIGTKLAEQITPGIIALIPDIVGADTIFAFDYVEVEDMGKLLAGINMVMATGLDGISPRFLKFAADSIALPVTHIINEVIRTNVVPRDWKTAHASPLFKDGKRDEINNYRPISILPVMAKIFERILHDQIQF